jgi:tRNA threonylcarbamoyladenosine biosynthesis protein TsaB|tara:strand:+ start:7516 stop:8196 length:681 start_codon:yes stop_codon:yes gene_type:complete
MSDILLLHLETSTKVCSVALSRNGELVALKEINEDNFSHGEKLTLFVEEIMNVGKVKFQELSGVSIASGPGSYTGLRIGTSTAKGFCYALNIPLLSIDALESLAEIAKKKYTGLNLCPMIDARRMEVYSAIYSSEMSILKPVSADILEENSYEEFGKLVCFGDGMPKTKEIWSERDIIFDNDILSSATGQIERVYQKYLNKEFEDVAYFEPFYLKDFIGAVKKNPV